mmetsp:Transcript_60907/g.199426  ORF Transcript_60907/g.199426 Transcript_60907/m.199426 type:complete len:381 (+) Transcript_60907:1037-2179(+)
MLPPLGLPHLHRGDRPPHELHDAALCALEPQQPPGLLPEEVPQAELDLASACLSDPPQRPPRPRRERERGTGAGCGVARGLVGAPPRGAPLRALLALLRGARPLQKRHPGFPGGDEQDLPPGHLHQRDLLGRPRLPHGRAAHAAEDLHRLPGAAAVCDGQLCRGLPGAGRCLHLRSRAVDSLDARRSPGGHLRGAAHCLGRRDVHADRGQLLAGLAEPILGPPQVRRALCRLHERAAVRRAGDRRPFYGWHRDPRAPRAPQAHRGKIGEPVAAQELGLAALEGPLARQTPELRLQRPLQPQPAQGRSGLGPHVRGPMEPDLRHHGRRLHDAADPRPGGSDGRLVSVRQPQLLLPAVRRVWARAQRVRVVVRFRFVGGRMF